MHNLEQAEKDQEEQLNAAAAGGGDQEADDEDDEDDEDGYDSGSGFPSALTPPDSPPFQVRILQKWSCMVFWGPSAVLCVH